MPTAENVIQVAAPVEKVWPFVSNVANWGRFTSGFGSAERARFVFTVDGGPALGPGGTVKLGSKGGITTWTVTAWEPPHRLTLRKDRPRRLPPFYEMAVTIELARAAAAVTALRLRVEYEWKGPMNFLASLFPKVFDMQRRVEEILRRIQTPDG